LYKNAQNAATFRANSKNAGQQIPRITQKAKKPKKAKHRTPRAKGETQTTFTKIQSNNNTDTVGNRNSKTPPRPHLQKNKRIAFHFATGNPHIHWGPPFAPRSRMTSQDQYDSYTVVQRYSHSVTRTHSHRPALSMVGRDQRSRLGVVRQQIPQQRSVRSIQIESFQFTQPAVPQRLHRRTDRHPGNRQHQGHE